MGGEFEESERRGTRGQREPGPPPHGPRPCPLPPALPVDRWPPPPLTSVPACASHASRAPFLPPLLTLISQPLTADPSETEFAFPPLGSFLLAKQKGSRRALTPDLPAQGGRLWKMRCSCMGRGAHAGKASRSRLGAAAHALAPPWALLCARSRGDSRSRVLSTPRGGSHVGPSHQVTEPSQAFWHLWMSRCGLCPWPAAWPGSRHGRCG